MSAADPATLPSAVMPYRLWIYLREMFPLGKHLPLLLASFLGLYGCLQAQAGATSLVIGPVAVTGFIAYFGMSLTMRIYDEFKDRELDRVLFPHRPFPRGAVHAVDLITLGAVSMGLGLALNLREGWLVWPFLAMHIFAWLSFKWFFLEERHRSNLLLSFTTHQPLGLFVNAYVIANALHALTGAPPPALDAQWLLPLFAFFFPVSAWETSRKIRAPEQETAYVTYSSLLGPRRACLMPLIFMALTAGLLMRLVLALDFATWTFWAIGLAALGHAAVCIRFIVRPTAANNHIRTATETAAGLMFGLFLVQLFTQRTVILFGWSL
ncbi:UbiA family prenyltransferase [Niveispirillum sp.]|uniref:UbiA family prenyltransferase n=1 Tax=Niveispirillum sp. TaxID=1917217 RepID=UPI001B67FE17|nr:UbiA family prenyltransferase [Niveispirillum sp.]MBP7337656.1 UbiA family prenyltransferase [Niveispirillum sp.]